MLVCETFKRGELVVSGVMAIRQDYRTLRLREVRRNHLFDPAVVGQSGRSLWVVFPKPKPIKIRLPLDSHYPFPRVPQGSLSCHSCLCFPSVHVSRCSHNPKVGGSNPPPATNLFNRLRATKRISKTILDHFSDWLFLSLVKHFFCRCL